MQEKQMTTEMIEFHKSVKQLWASYESFQRRFSEDEPITAKHFNSKYYRSLARVDYGINDKQAQDDDINIALKTTHQ